MSGCVAGPEVLRFRLPAPPPSINALYNVMFSMRRVEMKPEVRLYKNNMKMYVPGWEVECGEKVDAHFEVVDNWYFKNGKFRKQDVQNVVKVLVDLVSEKQGWDDSQVWNFTATKRHSEMESCVNVTLRKLKESNHEEIT
jgi:Holliday junction resolvase RusA-like endonuclease